jgi:hypothetical protein
VDVGQRVLVTFEISFSEASNALAGLFAGNYTLKGWELLVSGGDVCIDDDQSRGDCIVAEDHLLEDKTPEVPHADRFGGLQVTGPEKVIQPTITTLGFDGEMRAEADGAITGVTPILKVLAPDGSTIAEQTASSTFDPVPVVAGQDVELDIELLFE